MANLVDKSDRKTRNMRHKYKKGGKRIFTIPYKPIAVTVEVLGQEIRKIRNDAGLANQSDFAAACGWSQSRQNQFEAAGLHEMSLEQVLKMIRVCNGGQ